MPNRVNLSRRAGAFAAGGSAHKRHAMAIQEGSAGERCSPSPRGRATLVRYSGDFTIGFDPFLC
jgi:hypothetical protein